MLADCYDDDYEWSKGPNGAEVLNHNLIERQRNLMYLVIGIHPMSAKYVPHRVQTFT